MTMRQDFDPREVRRLLKAKSVFGLTGIDIGRFREFELLIDQSAPFINWRFVYKEINFFDITCCLSCGCLHVPVMSCVYRLRNLPVSTRRTVCSSPVSCWSCARSVIVFTLP